MIWVLLHHGRLYSQSNVPQVQAVFGHLTLCKAHRLELKHGEQLLPGVDDLALHTSHNMKHRHEGNSNSSTQPIKSDTFKSVFGVCS